MKCITQRSVLLLVSIVTFSASNATGQIVQLPTLNTFSIQTSVSAPDQGSAYLGGIGRSSTGSIQRGPRSSFGGSSSGGGATVHTTIIDLDELDAMIRSQASDKPTKPNLNANKSNVSKYPHESLAKYSSPPDYAYLMAMSHSVQDDKMAFEDAKHYLALAADARKRANWASVELYYRLAWTALPEGRRNAAMKELESQRLEHKETETATSTSKKTAR